MFPNPVVPDTDTPPSNLTSPNVIDTTGRLIGLRTYCIARHGKAINVVFYDGDARTVPLKELWQLKWHRTFVPRDVKLPAGVPCQAQPLDTIAAK